MLFLTFLTYRKPLININIIFSENGFHITKIALISVQSILYMHFFSTVGEKMLCRLGGDKDIK